MSGEIHRRVSNEEDSSVIIVNDKASATTNELPNETTTATAHADGHESKHDDSSSKSSVAKGLSSIISTVVRDFDNQVQQTARSQDQLSSAIDRLTKELDKLLEDAPSPFIMQHAAKISGVRKRVLSLNSVLKSIQRRVDNIDHRISAGLPNGN